MNTKTEQMEKHKVELKEGEEFCTKCGLSPENETHLDCIKYGTHLKDKFEKARALFRRSIK